MDIKAEVPGSGVPPRGFEVTHRLVLSIALPMTLGYLTTPLLGITDTAVAGRTGEAVAIAGLAIGSVIFDLIFASFNFLRSSTTGLVAQAYGRGRAAEQQAVFWRSFLLALALGFALLLASPLLLTAGLALMAPPPGVAEAATTYFAIRILAGPASLANFTILGTVLGCGRSKTALMLQILLSVVNIAVSVLLGLVLGFGIVGIAWGTVAAETTAAIAGVLAVRQQFRTAFRPVRSEILDVMRLKELFSLNRDILIRTFVLIGSFTLMTRIGTSFGTLTLAANSVLMNILMISGFFLDGMATAAEQLSGRAVGAGYRAVFDRALKLTTIWSLMLGGGATLIFLIGGQQLVDLMTTSASVRSEAAHYLPWAAATGITGALAFLLDGVFIGATWSSSMRNMMLAAAVGYLAALAVFVPALGNHGLWLSLNLFLLLRGLFLLAALPGRTRQSFRSAQ